MSTLELLEHNPIIASVKNEEELELALKSSVQIIFVLFGSIMNIKKISNLIEEKGKVGIIHLDLVDGFVSTKEIVLSYLKKNTSFKGIISTKPHILKIAKNYGLLAIQRLFIFDTLSFTNSKKHLISGADAIEILPGILPKVIEDMSKNTLKPIITGGLIENKQEIILALKSGATCVSTTKQQLWSI
ncbi:glycerol-3-phosphate responsive antiterminator [Clostridium taeniosporum]|uniref:Glycerol-3-phosphate responsive antiterminator n=1 Tax=Clostridium taeniosporum TaxID=394958 RepID=A0A1D7XGK8_9CLOT|nr:glycerol-3-phosphate responsive antiterminator [Clostridium taeniosporum]AOR22495.1 glycerol-3-phosphate responsive antiterminator [Clostridium taeniosporum]